MSPFPAPCGSTEVHPSHWTDRTTSCPGIDPEPLAPERDRDHGPEFDWTPESLNLSDAAALVVRSHMPMSLSYYPHISMWMALTGLEEPEALTYAYSVATLHPAATAVVPPF